MIPGTTQNVGSNRDENAYSMHRSGKRTSESGANGFHWIWYNSGLKGMWKLLWNSLDVDLKECEFTL